MDVSVRGSSFPFYAVERPVAVSGKSLWVAGRLHAAAVRRWFYGAAMMRACGVRDDGWFGESAVHVACSHLVWSSWAGWLAYLSTVRL